MNIGTWNVLSWYRTGASLQTIEQRETLNMDITAVQKITWPEPGNIRIKNSVVFYSGSREGKHEFGTGFVINKHLLGCVINKSKKLCYICIKGE